MPGGRGSLPLTAQPWPGLLVPLSTEDCGFALVACPYSSLSSELSAILQECTEASLQCCMACALPYVINLADVTGSTGPTGF